MTTTVRLLATYDGSPPQTLRDLPDTLAAFFVAQGNASLDLTGGIPYVAYVAPDTYESAKVRKTPVGTIVGITDANGAPVAPGGGGAADIPFSLAIPLTSGGSAYMPQQNVTGAMAFTLAAGAVKNSLVYLRLVANGTNTPTFTGFKEWGGSLGYDNRAGIVNQIQFFYDGYDAYYTASQAVGATSTATGVTLTGPTSGTSGVASTNFTVGVTPVGGAITGSVVVTPSAGAGGGTFTPTTVTLTTAAPTATFTYTPASAGAKTISVTNNGGLTNPTSITYTSNAADTTAPVIQSATMNGTTLVMTYNEALTANSPTPASISLVVDGAAGVNPTAVTASGTTVTSTFATPVTAGQVLAVTYTAGAVAIKDAAGNNAANLTSYSVTNNTGAVAPERLINTRLLTEGGSAGAYTYTGTGAQFNSAGNTDGAGVLNIAFQSGVDGSFSLVSTVTPVASTGPEIVLGVDVAATVGTYATLDYCMVNHPAGYAMFVNGTGGAADTTVAGAANDVMGITRTGSTLVFRVSKNGGSTWTTIKTYTGVSTGVLYVHVRFAYASNATTLTSTGLA